MKKNGYGVEKNKKKSYVQRGILAFIFLFTIMISYTMIYNQDSGQNKVVEAGLSDKIVNNSSENIVTFQSEFYDYYSDEELENAAGETPGSITKSNTSQNTFQHFNEKLYSSVYQQLSSSFSFPYRDLLMDDITMGNWGSEQMYECQFPLYLGFIHPTTDSTYWNVIKGYSAFMGANGMQSDNYNNTGVQAVTQALINNKLSTNGDITQGSRNLVVPYFNKTFLQQKYLDTSNIVMGEVREDITFPFRKKESSNGIDTYIFNSNDDILRFDTTVSDKVEYYYQDDTKKVYDSTGSTGFLPYNNAGAVNTELNYGFGTKIEIPFYMTEDGNIEGNPIYFEVSGDDDIWVFIDGYLVLDMGGVHSRSSGMINLSKDTSLNTVDDTLFYTDNASASGSSVASATAMVSRSKKRSTAFGSSSMVLDRTYYASVSTDILNNTAQSFSSTLNNLLLDTQNQHVLTVYRVERSMQTSSFQMAFNLPQLQTLKVGKELDISGVNDFLKNAAVEQANKDYFVYHIENKGTSEEDITQYLTYDPSADIQRPTAAPTPTSFPDEEEVETTMQPRETRNIVYHSNYPDPIVATDPSTEVTLTENIETGQKIILPGLKLVGLTEPKYYKFKGWTTDAAGTSSVTTNYSVPSGTSDIHLYAKWQFYGTVIFAINVDSPTSSTAPKFNVTTTSESAWLWGGSLSGGAKSMNKLGDISYTFESASTYTVWYYVLDEDLQANSTFASLSNIKIGFLNGGSRLNDYQTLTVGQSKLYQLKYSSNYIGSTGPTAAMMQALEEKLALGSIDNSNIQYAVLEKSNPWLSERMTYQKKKEECSNKFLLLDLWLKSNIQIVAAQKFQPDSSGYAALNQVDYKLGDLHVADDITQQTTTTGEFALQYDQSATFFSQFSRESTLKLSETGIADASDCVLNASRNLADYYSISWTIKDIENTVIKAASGSQVYDGRVKDSGTGEVIGDEFLFDNDTAMSVEKRIRMSVIFKNKIKTGTIKISKELTGQAKLVEAQEGTDNTFSFQVQLSNLFGRTLENGDVQDGKGILYNGKYLLLTMSEDGSTIESSEEKNCNAGIIQLQVDQSAVITGIPIGTTYKIIEIEDNKKESYYYGATDIERKVIDENDVITDVGSVTYVKGKNPGSKEGTTGSSYVTGTVETAENTYENIFTNDIFLYENKLHITIKIDKQYYEAGEEFIDNKDYAELTGAKQSFVLDIKKIIPEYNTATGTIQSYQTTNFQTVVTFTNADVKTDGVYAKEITLSDLTPGYYIVKEDMDWSWKYDFSQVRLGDSTDSSLLSHEVGTDERPEIGFALGLLLSTDTVEGGLDSIPVNDKDKVLGSIVRAFGTADVVFNNIRDINSEDTQGDTDIQVNKILTE